MEVPESGVQDAIFLVFKGWSERSLGALAPAFENNEDRILHPALMTHRAQHMLMYGMRREGDLQWCYIFLQYLLRFSDILQYSIVFLDPRAVFEFPRVFF